MHYTVNMSKITLIVKNIKSKMFAYLSLLLLLPSLSLLLM